MCIPKCIPPPPFPPHTCSCPPPPPTMGRIMLPVFRTCWSFEEGALNSEDGWWSMLSSPSHELLAARSM